MWRACRVRPVLLCASILMYSALDVNRTIVYCVVAVTPMQTVSYDVGAMPAAARTTVPRSHQVNFRLAHDSWIRLDVAAGVLGVPQSRLVAEALKLFFDNMPANKRRVIDDAIALRTKP